MLLLLALVLTGCGGSKALSPSEAHEQTDAYGSLVLQIELSKEIWSRGQETYSASLLEKLAQAGRKAVSVRNDPKSTEEQCEEARTELKAVTEEVRGSVVSISALTDFAKLIQRAEDALSSVDEETAEQLKAAIEQAYGVYSAGPTASEIQEASANLKKLLR